MKWFQDDIRFLERIIGMGRIEYALHLLERYPGLPKDAAADMYRWLSHWQPSVAQLRTSRLELLHRLQQLKHHETQQESLLDLRPQAPA